ncbi:MAG TPA: RluA family pseudouridine synthase [Candidatus Ozemobacteraceae bacterium]|nr:RluA family pseudouridine synthase [Candidatus Ozemobacteraceae bacterium]
MTRILEFTLGPEANGARLDAALAGKAGDLSRTALQELIRQGALTVDGKTVKPGLKLKGGESIRVELPEKSAPETISATPLTFPIIFEDEHLVVVNKPAGLVTHPGAGHETESVVSALLSHARLSPIGAPLRPGVVHRLDKGTSGLMVVAKTEAVHRKLARSFAGRQVTKEYLALVQGRVADDRGRIEVAIERDRLHRKRMKATYGERGRMAVSVFEVIERLRGASLVRIRIETGRTHQIRVHMAFLGHPLLGDVLYGGKRIDGKAVHHLHSARLALKHPVSGVPTTWEAPLPNDFSETLASLRAGPGEVPAGARRPAAAPRAKKPAAS